jgi:hypothetical protein
MAQAVLINLDRMAANSPAVVSDLKANLEALLAAVNIVDTAQLSAGSVTEPKLADNAATNRVIADGSVILAKLPDGVFTADSAGRAKFASQFFTLSMFSSQLQDWIGLGTAKSLIKFDGTGTPTVTYGQNIAGITDNGTGDFTINFTSAFANTNIIVCGGANFAVNGSNGTYWTIKAVTTSSVRLVFIGQGAAVDLTNCTFAFFGVLA